MKTISIGDIHGSTLWKSVDPDDWDKIIFSGDYVDHWTYTDAHILKNFKEIIEFKECNPDKVVLLLGNHDLQYMFSNSIHSCSGWRPSMASSLSELFTEKKALFQPAYYKESGEGAKFLWTHAGVSEGWYEDRFKPMLNEMCLSEKNDIGVQLNIAFKLYRKELFDCGYQRGGRHVHGGIVWADRAETQRYPLPGINQIVGHSKVRKIQRFEKEEENASITYIDTLEGENPDFFELEIQ